MSRAAKLATWATALVVLAGYAGVLALNYPGHLSVDSVLQLYEGRFHVRETWGPAIYAWLLGLFDSVVPGTGLYLVAAAALLFGAWLWLIRIEGRASWFSAVVAALLIATPNILIYQGIVWRDVLFANLAVFGFTALAAVGKRWRDGSSPWIPLTLSAVALAVAALVRQNGPALWLVAAIVVAWVVPARRFRRRLGWGGGWLAATAVLAGILSVTALPQGPALERANDRGVRLLQFYDIAGALQREPDLPLPALERSSPSWTQDLRVQAQRHYSPERIDFLNEVPIGRDPRGLGKKAPGGRNAALQSDWLRLITQRPDLYLAVRLEVLRWTVMTPVIDRCLPVHVGVGGPPAQMQKLGMRNEVSHADQRLYNYATWFFDTAVMRHATWLVIAALIAVVLLIRRRPADIAVAGMLVGVIGFAASFLPISLACDYRYLYFADLAAMTGLFYLALDPLNRASQASATSSRGRRASTNR